MPKRVLYNVNGSGRDSYISYNNGGYTTGSKVTQGVRTSLVRPASACNIPTKTLNYKTNGSGRDTYIYTDSGGLHNGIYKGESV